MHIQTIYTFKDRSLADQFELVYHLARRRNETELREISKYIPIDVMNEQKRTPCTQLAFENNITAVLFLIDRFDIDLGRVLWGAMYARNKMLVTELKRRGASIRISLINAAASGQIDLVKELLEEGGDIRLAMVWAAKGGEQNCILIDELLRLGARLEYAVAASASMGIKNFDLTQDLIKRGIRGTIVDVVGEQIAESDMMVNPEVLQDFITSLGNIKLAKRITKAIARHYDGIFPLEESLSLIDRVSLIRKTSQLTVAQSLAWTTKDVPELIRLARINKYSTKKLFPHVLLVLIITFLAPVSEADCECLIKYVNFEIKRDKQLFRLQKKHAASGNFFKDDRTLLTEIACKTASKDIELLASVDPIVPESKGLSFEEELEYFLSKRGNALCLFLKPSKSEKIAQHILRILRNKSSNFKWEKNANGLKDPELQILLTSNPEFLEKISRAIPGALLKKYNIQPSKNDLSIAKYGR